MSEYVSMLRFKDIVQLTLSADVKRAVIRLLDADEYVELLKKVKEEHDKNAEKYVEDEGEEEALKEMLSFAVTSLLNLLSTKGLVAPEEQRPLFIRMVNDIRMKAKALGRTPDEVIANMNDKNKRVLENYLKLFGTTKTLVRRDLFIPIDEILEHVFSLLLLRNVAEFEEPSDIVELTNVAPAFTEQNYII